MGRGLQAGSANTGTQARGAGTGIPQEAGRFAGTCWTVGAKAVPMVPCRRLRLHGSRLPGSAPPRRRPAGHRYAATGRDGDWNRPLSVDSQGKSHWGRKPKAVDTRAFTGPGTGESLGNRAETRAVPLRACNGGRGRHPGPTVSPLRPSARAPRGIGPGPPPARYTPCTATYSVRTNPLARAALLHVPPARPHPVQPRSHRRP